MSKLAIALSASIFFAVAHAPAAAQAAPKAVVKPAAKPSGVSAKKPVGAVHNKDIAAQINKSRAGVAGVATGAAAGTVVASSAIDPLVAQVLTGVIRCELGQTVTVSANAKKAGHFNVTAGKTTFDMKPVATSTGAVRLQDKARGGVWLQLGNKSMLMNERLGQRVADDCVHPQQTKWMAEAATKPPAADLLGAVQGAQPSLPVLTATVAPAASVPAGSTSTQR